MNFLYPRTLFHIAAIGEATSGTEGMKKSARDTEERYVEWRNAALRCVAGAADEKSRKGNWKSWSTIYAQEYLI